MRIAHKCCRPLLATLFSRSLCRKFFTTTAATDDSSSNQPSRPLKSGVLPRFSIIDTTLREGEQFATADFTSSDRVYIAKMLDRLGVEYIEMANPAASASGVADLANVASLGLKAKVLCHTRCSLSDVKLAVSSGCAGVNIYMATSPILAQHSHGKAISEIGRLAAEVIAFVKGAGLEVRFSCEDTFRSHMGDVLGIYRAVAALGVDRIGIADTVGIASAWQVNDVVSRIRDVIPENIGIEFHCHNDTEGCISNALVALEAGATHIDTCVLGIGERNGITPLGGFLARMYSLDRAAVKARYDLKMVSHLERFVAQITDAVVPFNNYVTGSCAFTHKAGVHTKAVLNNPSAYEIICPEDFGVNRRVQLVHRLTGWNVIQARATELGLEIPVAKLKALTSTLKTLSESRNLTVAQLDTLLINLAHPPREHGTFVSLSSSSDGALTPQSMAQLEEEVTTALSSLGTVDVDTRASITLQFIGHLFDKAVMNVLLDIAAESGCDFKVVKLEPGRKDEVVSRAVVRLVCDNEEQLEQTRDKMAAVAKLYEVTACMAMHELGRSYRHKATCNRHTRLVRVSGHLFDKAVFNRILDIVVLANCDFEVVSLEVGPADEHVSTCEIRLSMESAAELNRVLKLLQSLVESSKEIAQTTFEDLTQKNSDGNGNGSGNGTKPAKQ